MSRLHKCVSRFLEAQTGGGRKSISISGVRQMSRSIMDNDSRSSIKQCSSCSPAGTPATRNNDGAKFCKNLIARFSSTKVPSRPSPVKKIPDFGNLNSSTITRTVATSQRYVEAYKHNMENTKLLTKQEYEDFSAVFKDLVRDIIEDPDLRDMPETNEWVAKMLNYNVPHGKQNRALACASAYRYLTADLTDENVHLSYVLGWCVEILQAFFVVMDDIMDDSATRRGRPCWYKVENNGLTACNDGIILENCVYRLLKKYFGTKPYYANLLEIFHDVTLKTAYGQSLDTRTGAQKQIETYSYELYSSIVKYKTSYYSFCLPVSLAMVMAGINDPELLEQAEAITLEMGHFFQVQDDYLDAFGDAEVTGKIGTDIQDGKCSWLVVMALQQATPEQRQLILENYGVNNPEKVDKVKECYLNMRLQELYLSYEEQNYNLIISHIQHLSAGLPKKLFEDMLSKLYRRAS